MPIEKILRGLNRFQKTIYPKTRKLFEKLAVGQKPQALFITCSDSRIDPCLLTQTKPGELFICRVIGNVVPRYPKKIGGVSATIEYAVGVLKVPDVIICGHSDCGVMKAALNPGVVKSLPNVKAWLRNVPAARRLAGKSKKSKAKGADPEALLSLTERNVVAQLENLCTHPAVAARLRKKDLRLHGWVYHIGQGIVTAYDPEKNRFSPVGAFKRQKKKPRAL